MSDYQLSTEQRATLAKLKRDNENATPTLETVTMPEDKTADPLPVVEPNG